MASLPAKWLLLVAVCCSALACSDSDDDRRIVRSTYESEGGLCLRASSGEMLAVTVVFPPCLSSSCNRVLGASCEVTPSGNQLVITGKAETESTGAGACTADCGALVAHCTSPATIPPGPYTVKFGAESAEVTLAQNPVELFADGVPFRPCSVN